MNISTLSPLLLFLFLLIIIVFSVARLFELKLNHGPLYKQGLFILSITLLLYSFIFFGFFFAGVITLQNLVKLHSKIS